MTDRIIITEETGIPQSVNIGNPNYQQRNLRYNQEAIQVADEEQATESTTEKLEVEESPTPAVPSVTSEAPTSAPTFDADAIVEKLAGRLDQIVEDKVSRTFQSAKDRRFADVEKISQYLQAHGGDVSKATREMQLDELYERVTASEGGAGTPSQGNESSQAYMEARTAQLLSGAGIDFEDPDYKMLAAQYQGRITNPDQWIGVVEGFVGTRVAKQAKQESVPAAAAASEGGKTITSDNDDIDGVTSQLTELMAKPKTPENMAKRAELREKLAELQSSTDYTLIVDRN